MAATIPTIWDTEFLEDLSGPLAGTAGGGVLIGPSIYWGPLKNDSKVSLLDGGEAYGGLVTLPDFTFARYEYGENASFRVVDRNLTWKGPAQSFADLAIETDLQLTINKNGTIGAVITRFTEGQDDHQVYFGSTETGFENAVMPYAANSDRNFDAVISVMDDSNFIVAWQREDSAGNMTIMMSVVTSEGAILEERAVSDPVSGITNPSLERLTDGSYVITWEDSSNSRFYYQALDSSGATVGTPNFIEHDGVGGVALLVLNDGGFLVAWNRPGEPFMGEVGTEWDDHDVFMQRFDSDGSELGTFTKLATYHSEDVYYDLVELRDGRVAVTYRRGIDYYGTIIDPRGDTIVGGADQYVIYGRLEGGTIIGHGGDDLLFGMGASDHLFGGAGADELNGGAGVDTLEGGAGNDIYYVDNASDVVSEAAAGSSGIDEVRTSVSYTLAAIAAGGLVENLTLLRTTQNIDGVGNAADNIITGNKGNNKLSGLGGNDRLVASYGDDTLIGGNGDDALFGTFGDDVLNGGLGADYLSGGDGRDRASYTEATAGVVASLLNPSINTGAAKGDTYHSIEILNGSTFNDTLGGDNNANELWGLTGNDKLSGGNGNDILKGDEGIDKLNGGAGADHLYGGTGADTFIFTSYTQSTLVARDIIYDFSRAQADKIDLSAIDARTTGSGNQAFTFIGTAEFSKKAGELRAFVKNGETFIHGDLNGDSGIDFSVKLATAVNLISSEFIL